MNDCPLNISDIYYDETTGQNLHKPPCVSCDTMKETWTLEHLLKTDANSQPPSFYLETLSPKNGLTKSSCFLRSSKILAKTMHKRTREKEIL